MWMIEKIMNLHKATLKWKKNESQISEENLALQNNTNDNEKWRNTEHNTAKINRSKYKGRTIYHHGNKVKFSNSLREKINSSYHSASKFYSEIVHEIEEDKNDEGFFRHLEADDQQYL